MSVEEIKLKHFKGFSEASVSLKPLTVLLGPNSSGKSSFGHALAAMAHAHWLNPSSSRASLTPHEAPADWPVDLGMLRDLRTGGADANELVYICLRTSEGWIEEGFGRPDSGDLMISYFGWPSPKESGHEISSVLPSTISPVASSGAVISGTIAPSSPSLRGFRRINDEQWMELPGETEIRIDLTGLILRNATHPGGTGILLNNPAQNELQRIFSQMTYLRATRQRPLRAYDTPSGRIRQPIGYGGEHTAFVLSRHGHDPIELSIPPGLPDDANAIGPLINADWEVLSTTVAKAIELWLKRLELAEAVEAIPIKGYPNSLQLCLKLRKQTDHDITEVGFGISQVLPVLVAGLMQSAESLFIVDLPEAHLHPRPQAALADFFCSLARSGKRVLVETHSETFIHQLRLRIELNPELDDEVAVYFADEPAEGQCRLPRLIRLRERDEIRWPVGFLQESWEIETKIHAVRDRRRREKR